MIKLLAILIMLLSLNWPPAPATEGWIFLGTATVSPWTVSWASQPCTEFMFHYYIPSNTSGTGVARFLVGSATLSTTALTNGSSLSEGVTTPTSAPSIPGMPLAVTLSNVSRDGWIFAYGPAGTLKRLEALGQNSGTVASPPTMFRAVGVFSDLGTNAQLTQARLALYDSLTATAVSANNFSTGTQLEAWCRNVD